MQVETVDVQEWEWQVFDRSQREHADAMDALLRSGQVRKLRDDIDSQLDDLARVRSRRSAGAAARARDDDLADAASSYDFGRWIYYPWSGSLVHLLPPAEFRELRLDRNRHKITSREQERLAGYTVAIVGLSAGNVVARTLCLEGVSERFKLADFDVLALSNLNRLEAGVDELGLRKTVLLARRLCEINPYCQLSLWDSGLTSENLDQFLLQAPRPHVLIDECDDIRMKLLLRERARGLRIPVLMETSDRGMMDIERFDLEPERPILHGLVPATTSPAIQNLTEEQRLALVLAIVDADSISTRAAASLLEINQTISTWPQLASDVVLGGAAMTIAVRRLALGQPLTSGRRYIDVDAILSNGPVGDRAWTQPQPKTEDAAARRIGQAHGEVPADSRLSSLISFVVEHGCLAPSGGNCQPWKFYADGMELWVVHDRRRSKNLLDSDHRGSLLALGAAIENMCVAAAQCGYGATIEPFPRAGNDAIVARLLLSPAPDDCLAENARLFEALGRRVTNRKRGEAVGLSEPQVVALSDAATSLGGKVQLVADRSLLARIGSIVGACDRIRFLCPALHGEMIGEVRWTPAEAQRTRDGLALDSLELTRAQAAIFRLLARTDVAGVLRELDAGRGLTQLSADVVAASSAVGLIAAEDDSPGCALNAGRAFERLWLEATALGIGVQPLGAVAAMFRMLNTTAVVTFSPAEQARLRELQTELHNCFPTIPPGAGLMLFRLSKAPAPTARSCRLPVGDVLFVGRPPEEVDHVN